MLKVPHILILEDIAADAELAMLELRQAKIPFQAKRVETKGAFLEALNEFYPDIILSNFNVPHFSALEALSLLKEMSIKTPFIFYSDLLSKEVVAECMKKGAADHIFKSSFERLPPAVLNILEKTESRRTKEEAIAALRESEKKYRELIENANDVLYTLDLSGRFTSLNRTGERLTGYTRYEALQMNFADVIDPNDVEWVRQRLAKNIQGAELPNFELEIIAKDGRRVTLDISSRVIRQDGIVVGIQGIGRDVTERKRVEQALIESEKLLQQSQKMEAIGTLTGGVAHDFNNLLTAILGNTQLALRKIKPEDPLHTRLTEIEKAGNRAAELTRKLLAFSRRQHLKRRTINLNDTIPEIMKLIERIIGEDVEISVSYAPNLYAVYADPTQIEQVIMNLSVNARDAMSQGGLLTIKTCNVDLDESYCREFPYVQPGKYVQISVSDSGSGMNKETLSHIFEPFFTTKAPGKGTGLGLSMAYGIVKQHDGHIHAYSELDNGTTFKIYLPASEESVETETETILSPSVGGSETILIAEDEESLRNLLKDILEGLGYRVLAAKDGEEAIEIFVENRERIDMLLFDVVMPRMNGVEAYERIRALNAGIPLILLTGYSAETVQSRFVKPERSAEEIGATVIQKPYSVDVVGRKVREVLAESQKLLTLV